MLLAATLIATASATAAPVRFDEVDFGSEKYLRIVSRASEYQRSDKTEASLSVSPEGRIGVAWQSRRQLNGLSGAYLREFSPMGLSLGGEEGVSSESRFHQSKPSLVFTDRWLAFFESAWRDDSGIGIFVGEKQVPQTNRGDQTDVVTAMLHDGKILAAWSSQISRFERRIFARVFDCDGVPVGGEFRVSSRSAGSEVLPAIAVNGKVALVTWQVLGADRKPGGIWGARLVQSAQPSGEQPLTSTAGVEPSASAAGPGFALTWAEPTLAGYRVRARVLGPDLSVRRELELPSQTGYQNGAAIAGTKNGVVAVAWNRSDATGDKEIFCRLFGESGDPKGAALRVHSGSLAEASGRTRLAWANESLCFAWSGDGGLGDARAAHLTVLAPKKAISPSVLRELAAASVKPGTQVVTKRIEGDPRVQFIEQAGPHEPPTYNPKTRIDPWGVELIETDAVGFNAVVDTGWTPPDPHMAVGPDHIGVMTNGQIAFFYKNGRNIFRDEIEDSFGFWGALGTTNFVFDPEIIYDDAAGAWMAMACERGSNGRSYFLLAVSDDEDPMGTWFKYRLDVTALGGGDDIDSPNLATDDECVYLSADFFTGAQKYLVYILRKSDVLQGSPTPLTRSHLITGQQSHGLPMTFDAGAPQYLIEHFEATSNTSVRLHAINDPLGTPTRSTFNLTVPSYGRPENPPQAGTSVRPTAFDSRFWSCVYRNGSLWATHHINSSRVLARWYEIRMNDWPNGGTPELVQSGDINAGGTVRTYFSSIAVDPNGNAAVVCARSSPTEFISMYRAMRKAGDPLGTMTDQAILKTSDGPYFISRWGDYSAAVVDPADNRTFWAHHEYAVAGSWRTWVASFAPAPSVEERAVEQIIPILAGPISGGLPEIAIADGFLMSVDSVANPPTRTFSSSVDYISSASPGSLVGLEVRVVAKSGAGVGFARLSLLNLQTGQYDPIGVEQISASALSTFTFGAGADVNRYVDPVTREMRMRLDFNLGPQPTSFRPPILIDEIKFITSY